MRCLIIIIAFIFFILISICALGMAEVTKNWNRIYSKLVQERDYL